jgi:hypothetical protein
LPANDHTVDWIAVVVSVVALFLAWLSYSASSKANVIAQKALDAQLTPSKLTFTLTDPFWIIEKPTGANTILPMLISSVTVTNDGMQQGCLSDLVARLTFPVTGDERRFTPLYFMEPRELLSALEQRTPVFRARSARFGPIAVLGKQQVHEVIAFYSPGTDVNQFLAGTYTIRLMAAECAAADKWRDVWSESYLFMPEDVAALLKGQPASPDSERRRKSIRAVD